MNNSSPTISIVAQPVAQTGVAFPIDIMFDPNGISFNALEFSVILPDGWTVKRFDDASSIIGLWVAKPAAGAIGNLNISGIIPGGFAGYIDPFSPAKKSAGKIARLYVTPAGTGNQMISVEGANAYQHDGSGTAMSINPSNQVIAVGTQPVPGMNIAADFTPPEDFVPVLLKDPLLGDGKLSLVFETRDAGTGVDYYMVREGSGNWKMATSPYAFHRNKIHAPLSVQAVDGAGNATFSYVPIPIEYVARPIPIMHIVFFAVVGIVMMSAIIVGIKHIYIYVLRKRSEKNN